VVARNIPASVLDRLLEKLSDKFSVPVSSFEWEKADTMSEMDGQNFVGGMTAGYQQHENQPVDEDYVEEKWSQKYKSSINCASPKGFSQRAHCAGRKK
jgi:hypothetical protein